MRELKRRDILKAGVGAAALGFPALIRAQQKEVVILGLWDQTGAFADVGPLNDRGMRMALEERGMKVLGKPLQDITRDGANHAGTPREQTPGGLAARESAARKGSGKPTKYTTRAAAPQAGPSTRRAEEAIDG